MGIVWNCIIGQSTLFFQNILIWHIKHRIGLLFFRTVYQLQPLLTLEKEYHLLHQNLPAAVDCHHLVCSLQFLIPGLFLQIAANLLSLIHLSTIGTLGSLMVQHLLTLQSPVIPPCLSQEHRMTDVCGQQQLRHHDFLVLHIQVGIWGSNRSIALRISW